MLLGGALAPPASAEVVIHGTGELRAGAIAIGLGDGDLRGTNLFHSFSRFDVDAGESVTFAAPMAPPAVANVVSRVTGSQRSSVDGLIASTWPGADVFIINPNGIDFLAGARLDVNGSFHASTAEALHLADGGVFFADPSAPSVLTAAAPSAFGFGASPASITVSGGFPTFSGDFGDPIGIPAGATLGLVGGDVTIGERAIVSAARSRIGLTSVASPGAVPVGAGPDVSAFAELGTVTVRGESLVDGQEVFIRGGRFVVADATVSPGALSLVFGAFAGPDGGQVDVDVRGDVAITSTLAPRPGADFGNPVQELPPGIYAFSATADLPRVSIRAGALTATGRGGAEPGALFGGVVSERFATGGSGGMEIWADRIEVRDGAEISSINYAMGAGADLALTAGEILLSRDGAASFTGIAVQARDQLGFLVTDAGRLTVDAGRLEVRTGAEISNESFAFGRAADVAITAGTLVGSRDGAATGGITSQSGLAGAAGRIDLRVGELILDGGFQVSTSIAGAGDAGGIAVVATEGIELSGVNTGLFSTANDINIDLEAQAEVLDRYASSVPFFADGAAVLAFFGGLDNFFAAAGVANEPGQGGTITVEAPRLVMRDDSRIDSSTRGDGAGGAVVARVGAADLSGSAQIRSQSGGRRLVTNELVAGSGPGGRVELQAVDVDVRGTREGKRAGLSASTLGPGNGGDVVVVADRIRLAGGAAITSESLATEADLPPLTEAGDAGDIRLVARDRLVLDHAVVSTESKVTGGGNIVFEVGRLVDLLAATVTTSAGSALDLGSEFLQDRFLGGGDIDIDPDFVVLQSSTIQANAFAGRGGNITIITGQFLASPDSIVEARSVLDIDGTIRIESPDEDVSSSLVVLPESFLDADARLKSLCEARRAGGAGNSLVVRGEGGIPPSADGYLTAYAPVGAAAALAAGAPDDHDFRIEPGSMLAAAWSPPGCRWQTAR